MFVLLLAAEAVYPAVGAAAVVGLPGQVVQEDAPGRYVMQR